MATKEVIEDNNIWITVSTAQTENSGQSLEALFLLLILLIMIFKEVPNAHQYCIYSMTNTVKDITITI